MLEERQLLAQPQGMSWQRFQLLPRKDCMKTTSDPSFPKCQPREGMRELHTLNFCMKLFYVNYSGATTSLWSSSSCSGGSLESVGSSRCHISAEEMRLMFVESKSCSVWNFFFKWWFSKRGTNKAKKSPQSLPALLQRPFLGMAGPLASFATKELARTS